MKLVIVRRYDVVVFTHILLIYFWVKRRNTDVT